MRKLCKKAAESRWFNIVTWCVIFLFTAVMLPEILAILGAIKATTESVGPAFWPPWLYYSVYYATCAWFVFEMVVRILAEGLQFFRSRRNLFDLLTSALTLVPYCDWFAILRLMRNLFSDSTETPKREEKRGTLR